ncbi:GerAB/ArcD/ProY family transporter [Peribacillus sp. R9-11]|uniref:GerAB/ArcD/ProY family transporter n=1 Tax=Peribacillus sp. R9-11 TaxID=3073271 RepID=UPI0037C6554B
MVNKSVIFLFLLYYIASIGFRVITVVCFWRTVIPFVFLFPLLFFSLKFAQFNHLLPLFNHSVKEILGSSKIIRWCFSFLALRLYSCSIHLSRTLKNQKNGPVSGFCLQSSIPFHNNHYFCFL